MATTMQRGFRDRLEKYIDVSSDLAVEMHVDGTSEYDCCCFGVDVNDKLSDESYMIFYNQTRSPGGEIVMTRNGGTAIFTISLNRLPSKINKLVFTANIDGAGTMGDIKSFTSSVRQSGTEALRLDMSGANFSSEKAIVAAEIYKKDVWRISCAASGFNGGLSDLLKAYGGEEGTPSPVPAKPQKVSLEKRLEKEAPQLVSLAKPLRVSLEKHKLTDVIAQVALLIDISGSMTSSFKSGAVQRVIDKIVPLAMEFDDNSEFELWYFGDRCRRMDSVTVQNYQRAAQNWKKVMRDCGGGTNLAPAVEEVVNEYKRGSLPAYVLCITDGETSNGARVKGMIKDASAYPIFWQFIGIGGSSYGILEDLDTMRGRKVDNANFFSLDDIDRIDNTELYSRMLSEFPQWLKEARRAGILR
ncbi:MAG: VWA domain-containing protein [Synergistaceae bacterium]|jgi:stress response protein SCP2|nr:VWA domain-containing protein [Synergistaceae bacterium]